MIYWTFVCKSYFNILDNEEKMGIVSAQDPQMYVLLLEIEEEEKVSVLK